MRDNSDGMIELVEAFEKGGQCFAVVNLAQTGLPGTFKFGISSQSYSTLKKILQERPFDSMPGIVYRYFISSCFSRTSLTVRIESPNDGKEISFDAPEDLVKNLVWFYQIEDESAASHLRYD